MKKSTLLCMTLLAAMTTSSAMAAGAMIHCGQADGTGNIFFDSTEKTIYINRDTDDLSSAVKMKVIRFSQSGSPFTLSAKATHPAFGTGYVYRFKMTENQGGTSGELTLVLTAPDLSTGTYQVPCQEMTSSQ
jgi:hypothetical protein